jgi:hypothetical protein
VAPNPRCYGGKKYRSGFEARVAQDLAERGVPFEYEGDKFPYQMQTMYVSDFVLPLGVVVECKGYLRATDRRQLKDVKRAYPDLDLRLLFQNAKAKLNWRAPKSQTYGQWATANGFPWAEGKVPDSWVLARE